MKHATALLGILASAPIAAASGPAWAADTVPAGPTTKQQVTPEGRIVGTIDFPQDIDWTRLAKLKPKATYVVTLSETNSLLKEVDVVDKKGRIIAKGPADNGPVFGNGSAVKFTATEAPLFATYKLKPPPSGITYPARYGVLLYSSCAHNIRTGCNAKPAAQVAVPILFQYDSSWYAATLQRGRTYTLSGAYTYRFACEGGAGLVTLGIAGPNGGVVAKPVTIKPSIDSGQPGCKDEDTPEPETKVLTFKAPRTGRYFVTVKGDYGFSRFATTAYFTLRG